MRKDVSPFATCCDWTWAIESRPPSPARRAPSRIGLEETVAAFTEAFKERTREWVPLDADQVAQALARKFGWRIQPRRAQHHRPVHAGPGSDPQLRVGTRARAAQLAREARGPCRGICQSAADSRHGREAAAASARRTAGTSQRASLRHRPAASGASTRTPQHPQARAPAGVRLESRTVHAPTDGPRDAARPPGPHLCSRRRLAARIAPLLGPRIAPSGPHAGKLGTIVVDSLHDAVSFPHSARAARRQFCHSLLVLAHNHQNGVVSPTDQDKELTRAIVLTAETVSVRVLDHLIVSAHESFSFRKAGLL